jgi:hypothetical protein
MPPLSIRIPDNVLEVYRSIGDYLRHERRFKLPPKLARIVEDAVDFNMKVGLVEINKDDVFFRARVCGVGQQRPYKRTEMGAPPKGKATAGRINPEGISYLYLADEPETAVAEVRPWKDARVSVGKFRAIRKLNVVNLDRAGGFHPNDAAKAFAALFLRSMYFSAPAHSDDKLAYIASQFISEVFRDRGVDGLQYASVLRDGYKNVALFDPAAARCQSVSIYRIEGIKYAVTEE